MMHSISKRLIFLWLLFCGSVVAAQNNDEQIGAILWPINSLVNIGGVPVEVLGNPTLVKTPYGQAVQFDGDGDRLLLNHNPLGDSDEFTIEVIFKPYDAFPNNWEPRFIHIESPDNTDRRITIELRLNANKQWYLDAYIKSELSQFTLIDETLVHPVNEWAHVAITYRQRRFTSYVNGQKELSAQVDYLPIARNGRVSIGSRINEVHWFNGVVQVVRITPIVLDRSDFLTKD
jgi:hypothetical protein